MEHIIHYIPIDRIIEGERQRKDYGDIMSLKLSIELHGLLYPLIVEEKQDGMYELRAGGRRLKALTELKEQTAPCFLVETLDDIQAKELELEENLRRKDLTYLERAQATREIDKLKREKYQSSLPILKVSRGWTQKDTAEELGISEAKVSEDIAIAEAAERYPEIATLTTKREILRYIRRAESGLIKLAPSEREQKMLDSICCHSWETLLKTFPANTIDLGIIDLREFVDYEPVLAKLLLHFSEFGSLFMFCDFASVALVQKIVRDNGLKCSDKPCIWHMRGMDDYVPFIYASHDKELPLSRFNIHQSVNALREPDHTREKPYQLYYNMITAQTNSADFVLEFTGYNVECAKVCLDHNRRCLLSIPNQRLFDMKKEKLLQK